MRLKCIGRASLVTPGAITVEDMATMSLVKVGDELFVSPNGAYDLMRDGGPVIERMRTGSARVERLDPDSGVIRAQLSSITGACANDWLYVDESASEDIGALEAYLASCVRRRDWHGVRDAACELEVLEAVEAATR